MHLIFKDYYLKHKPLLSSTPKSKLEVKITSELAKILGGRTEVQCAYGLGRIDILSHEWLIEAKYSGSTNEKNALGQLIVYSEAMNWRYNRGLAIIGTGYPIPGIRKFCRDKGITIFFYNLNCCRWLLLDDNREKQ